MPNPTRCLSSVPTTKNLEGLIELFPDRGIRKKTFKVEFVDWCRFFYGIRSVPPGPFDQLKITNYELRIVGRLDSKTMKVWQDISRSWN